MHVGFGVVMHVVMGVTGVGSVRRVVAGCVRGLGVFVVELCAQLVVLLLPLGSLEETLTWLTDK